MGVAWHMRVEPLGKMLRMLRAAGTDVIRMKLGPYHATLVRNPEHIKRVFVDNAANYTKQTRGYAKARIVLGDGLVTSEGELWQRQRRIATPAFGRQRVAGFAPMMTDATNAMLDDWRRRTRDKSEPLDVFREMMRVTLKIALQTLMGVSAEREIDELSPAVTEVLERTNDIITNPFSLPPSVPTPKSRRFVRAIGTLDRFVYDTIAKRRAESEKSSRPEDLLSMLMSARDEETGQGMSDKQLRDEAVTILIAGHETTANALTWTFYLLSKYPGAYRELREELDRVLNGRTPTFEDLPKLTFTRAVIEESMRLYPPAWMIGRSAVNDDVVGDYLIQGKTFVLVSPYVTHRHPGLWDNPEGFDPHRFLDGRADALPKFAYLPFGGGPRFCIGATFAMMEATLLLATIAQAVRLDLVGGFPVETFAMITLRPKHGLLMAPKW
jgi:cytochrome P450